VGAAIICRPLARAAGEIASACANRENVLTDPFCVCVWPTGAATTTTWGAPKVRAQ
jgi:hypothetical protein